MRTQIYIGMDIGYIDSNIGSTWIKETGEVSKMLGGLIRSKRNFIKNKENKK